MFQDLFLPPPLLLQLPSPFPATQPLVPVPGCFRFARELGCGQIRELLLLLLQTRDLRQFSLGSAPALAGLRF